MNSSVTFDSETSVMSSSCLAMSESSRSNGPSKFVRATRNAGSPAVPEASVCVASTWPASGDGATEDQLPGQLPVRLRRLVLGGEARDGRRGDRRVGKL